MDLIQTLTSELGIDANKAEGLAGSALGFIKGQVADKVGGEEATQVEGAIPELGGWEQKAEALTSQGDGGGLLGAAAGLLGGDSELGGLVSAVSKLGIDADMVQKALPVLKQFLESRLDGGLLQKVLSALPLLKGGGGGGGGLAGALGGLLGG